MFLRSCCTRNRSFSSIILIVVFLPLRVISSFLSPMRNQFGSIYTCPIIYGCTFPLHCLPLLLATLTQHTHTHTHTTCQYSTILDSTCQYPLPYCITLFLSLGLCLSCRLLPLTCLARHVPISETLYYRTHASSKLHSLSCHIHHCLPSLHKIHSH